MRVLLDEMLSIGVREFLPSHEVYSAAYAGLAGISNGEMIRRAIDAGFDVLQMPADEADAPDDSADGRWVVAVCETSSLRSATDG